MEVSVGRAKCWLLYAFAGFGYRPYRLLFSCLIFVAVFSAVYAALEPRWTPLQCVAISGMSHIAAVGYGDVREAAQSTQFVVIAQGFVSIVLNSTLFALLVRRWFRS